MRPILHQVRVPGLPRRARPWPMGGSAVPGAQAWIVNGGALTFTQGSVTPFAVNATGPTGVTTGGIYGVDPGGTALPAGMTLSEGGSLSVGAAAAQVASGVVFTYHEPGALPVLTVYNGGVTGPLPYHATVYLAEGVVPTGSVLGSPDDATLRASVLSRWPDNSARVVVVAGERAFVGTNGSSTVRIVPAAPSGTALTTARINALVSAIAVDFGGGLQTLTLSGATPDWTWWANERVICARYRLACGAGGLDAVIDIHAWAAPRNVARVCITVENSRVDKTAPTQPAAVAYAGATLAVNGTVFATVDDPVPGSARGTPTYVAGTHDAFRAFYVEAWVRDGAVSAKGGAADPQIEVTHDTAYMQALPCFNRIARTSSVDLQATYGADSYEPWSTERQRGAYMGGPGDSDGTIGPVQMWDTQYLQSGSRFARRAVIANNLAALSYNLSYRDTVTKRVSSLADVGARGRNGGGWPSNLAEPSWEVAHHPSVGFMGFFVDPNPVFIEICQKSAHWNATYQPDGTGFGYWYQTRGKAWSWRTLWQALWVTPDADAAGNADPWKPSAVASVPVNVALINTYRAVANPLGLVWDYSAGSALDHRGWVGFQQSIWQHYFLAEALHFARECKVVSGSALTDLNDVADWALATSVRYVNESPNGEWRLHRYQTTIGTTDYGGSVSGPTPGSLATWGAMFAWWHTSGTPPAESGPWLVNGGGSAQDWQAVENTTADTVAWARENYVVNFWGTFVCAVERDLPGASAAWSRVVAGIGSANLNAWLAGFQTNPTHGHWPRNK